MVRGDALPIGYVLDRYRIEQILGEGGFSITYLARHVHTGKVVVIKEFLPGEFALREVGGTAVFPRGSKAVNTYNAGLGRFIEEAKTLEEFSDHPNIVAVRDFFQANGTAYMVMQYEDGQTFEQWLVNHPRPTEAQLLGIIVPVLDGLCALHAKNYLHRDIKPENIYICNDGNRPLLIDFGASRQVLGEYSNSVTSIFTPGYAPKEQYSKRGNQGAWTDIYATGATLWRAISGLEPEPALDRGEAIRSGRPDPLRKATEVGRGRYSETFLRAIDRALAYEPEQRPQTVDEWLAALQAKKTPTKKTPQPFVQKQRPTVHSRPIRDTTKPHPLLSNFPLIALIIFLVFVFVWVWGKRTDLARSQMTVNTGAASDNPSQDPNISSGQLAQQPRITKAICLAGDSIHKAAARGQVGFVQSCLDAGVSVNVTEGMQWTPLHSAARNGQLAVAELLVGKGADVNALDITGRSPLDEAIVAQHDQIISFLESHGGQAFKESQNRSLK